MVKAPRHLERMGAGESSEGRELGSDGLAMALMDLKRRKASGLLTEAQYDAEMKALLAGGDAVMHTSPHEAGHEPIKEGFEEVNLGSPAAQPPPPDVTRCESVLHSPAGNGLAASAPVSQIQMAADKGPVADSGEPVFEELELGEGGLALKIIRLKGMRSARSISEAHFDWALKRLLRVRAFGCPGEHELTKGTTHLEGWTCNVCEKPLPLSMTVFSCRDCDWDGCKDCLNEAKRTASAEIKYDWWGDEEEEEDLADAAMGSDEYGVRTKFACAKGCTLTEARTSSASYQCDVCGMRLPASALIYSCRACDFDGCGLCYSRQPSSALGKITAAEENKVRCKCPQDHELSEYCTDSSDWACDECKEQQQAGAFMLGCRLCNWDTCLICAAATQAPSSLPAAIRPEAGSVNKVSLTREILRLKRSHAAGWLTEEEYNFELKKLLSSRSESVETNTLATNRATEDSSGKTKMFGCPYLHPMKVFLAPDDKWRCNWCNKGLETGALMIGCRACDWDGCADCHDAAREASGEILRGSICWYTNADGSFVESVVESVDESLSPPSYLVKVQGSVRETERHRLRQFLPLREIWAIQTGAKTWPEPQQVDKPPADQDTVSLAKQQQQQQQADRLQKLKEEHAAIERMLAQQASSDAPHSRSDDACPPTSASSISAGDGSHVAAALDMRVQAPTMQAPSATSPESPAGAPESSGAADEDDEEELGGDLGEGIMRLSVKKKKKKKK